MLDQWELKFNRNIWCFIGISWEKIKKKSIFGILLLQQMETLKLKSCRFKRKCGNELPINTLRTLNKSDSNLKEGRGFREIHTAHWKFCNAVSDTNPFLSQEERKPSQEGRQCYQSLLTHSKKSNFLQKAEFLYQGFYLTYIWNHVIWQDIVKWIQRWAFLAGALATEI